MPAIVAGRGVVTQINVFTVAPERQRALADLLLEAAHVVRDLAGWLSASIHVSLDGTQVANYAQCTSRAAWDGVMERLYARGYIDRIVALGTPAPCLYDVVATLDRAGIDTTPAAGPATGADAAAEARP